MTPSQYGIISAAVTLIAAPAGCCLSWRGRRYAAGVIGIGIVSVLAGLLLRQRPDLLVACGASRALLWFHGYFLPWGALILLGACLPRLRHRIQTVAVAGFCLAGAAFLANFSLKLAFETFKDLSTTPPNDTCRQSTSWSCGPAAAASLLAQFGVRADEAEMAGRCGTIPGRGTSDYGLWYGLRTSLDPREFEVALVKLGDQPLDTLPLPALVSFRPAVGYGHSIVLGRIGREVAIVADPSRPTPYFVGRGELNRLTRGSAIVVRPLHRAWASRVPGQIAEQVSRPAGRRTSIRGGEMISRLNVGSLTWGPG